MKASFLTRNTGLISQKAKELWSYGQQWLVQIPEKALLKAYEAALTIKNIENEQFQGKKISPESANYTENVMAYWQTSLDKNLIIIRTELVEFKFSRSLLNISNVEFLEKLTLIDEVISKYTIEDEYNIPEPVAIRSDEINKQTNLSNKRDIKRVLPVSEKTGALPRSIGRTLNQITGDFSPQAEQRFVRKFHISRARTRSALRFLALLVIVPILTHQISKQFLIIPTVERVRGENTPKIFLNYEMEKEALEELKNFEAQLRFEKLLHKTPSLSSEEVEKKVKERATEIAEEFREKGTEAISNVFADLFSLLAFAVVIATNRRAIAVVKSFMDEIVYGISDSAKAFIIILFTDIFVGFHSPHGWEVLMAGLAEHLGLPANESVISVFIATFPVILDTIFKYWIFRYLSRLSPSALATLKEMND